jgi:hypothetical protein
LFLKAGGWQTVLRHTKYNPHAYWYSFDFLSKVSIIGASDFLPRGKVSTGFIFNMIFD